MIPYQRVNLKGQRLAEVERRKVAIVDDDHAVRESLQFLLEIWGHAVEAFQSAAEFLDAEVQRFACLILDHHMPNMTGLELAEKLRSDGNLLPIMLITGSPSHTTFPALPISVSLGFWINRRTRRNSLSS